MHTLRKLVCFIACKMPLTWNHCKNEFEEELIISPCVIIWWLLQQNIMSWRSIYDFSQVFLPALNFSPPWRDHYSSWQICVADVTFVTWGCIQPETDLCGNRDQILGLRARVVGVERWRPKLQKTTTAQQLVQHFYYFCAFVWDN